MEAQSSLSARALTPKEAIFVGHMLEGATRYQAYAAAYSVGRMGEAHVIREADKVLARPHIRAQLEPALPALSATTGWSREESVQALRTIVEQGLPNRAYQAVIAAVKELNVMHGYHSPQQVDLTATMNRNIRINVLGVDPDAPSTYLDGDRFNAIEEDG